MFFKQEEVIIHNTPVDMFKVGNRNVYVKREDLSALSPAPPFSKCRGVYKRFVKFKQKGINIVGYTETTVSMAGWAVSYFSNLLGIKAVIFKPVYKDNTKIETYHILCKHEIMWRKFNADVIDIPASRLSINIARAKKLLHEKYGEKALMLPQGLPFDETIEETAGEWRLTMKIVKPKTTILCIGSGTMCAGILKGILEDEGKIIGVLVHPKNIKKKEEEIWRRSGRYKGGFFVDEDILTIIDTRCQYLQPSIVGAPFPCNPYYDLKAWEFLVKNVERLESPILFWNIGS